MTDDETMIEHLVRSRLSGDVLTTLADTRSKVSRLLSGDPACTFGLSEWQSVTTEDLARTLRETAGADLHAADDTVGYIDPQATLDGMTRYAEVLGGYFAGGANILLATGHPAGLLGHYATLARELEQHGNTLVAQYVDGQAIEVGRESGRRVRFLADVGCVTDLASLYHSHLPDYMNGMLDHLDAQGIQVDLVLGDHGMAGAAIERGIPTLAIADINDPALPLAYLERGLTGVIVIDDDLDPALFRPVTRYILDHAALPVA